MDKNVGRSNREESSENNGDQGSEDRKNLRTLPHKTSRGPRRTEAPKGLQGEGCTRKTSLRTQEGSPPMDPLLLPAFALFLPQPALLGVVLAAALEFLAAAAGASLVRHLPQTTLGFDELAGPGS